MTVTTIRSGWEKRLTGMAPAGALVLMAAPFLIWRQHAGNFAEYFQYPTPIGQEMYVWSKLLGLYAYVLLWLQILYGLSARRWAGSKPAAWRVDIHRALAGMALSLIVLHVFLFVGAASLRGKHLALQWLLPVFDKGYYAAMVSLGALALGLLLVAALCAVFRRYLGRIWKWGHWLALPAFALVCLHSLSIGSESRLLGMIGVYGLTLLATLTMLAGRFLRGKKD